MSEKPTINKQNIAKEIVELTAQMASLWSKRIKHEAQVELHKQHAYSLLTQWQQVDARRFILQCAAEDAKNV